MSEKKSEIIWTVKDVVQWDKIPADFIPMIKSTFQQLEEGVNEHKETPPIVNTTNVTAFTEEEMNLLREHLGARLVLNHWTTEELQNILQNLKQGKQKKRVPPK